MYRRVTQIPREGSLLFPAVATRVLLLTYAAVSVGDEKPLACARQRDVKEPALVPLFVHGLLTTWQVLVLTCHDDHGSGAQPLRLEAKTPQRVNAYGSNGLRVMGLGRVELPTSRLSGDLRGVRSPARSL